MRNNSFKYRLFAAVMSVLMFFSATGIAMDFHYCQGKFKSASVLGKAKTCHELAQVNTCPHHAAQSAESTKDNCCDNQLDYWQADQEGQITHADLQLNNTKETFDDNSIDLFAIQQGRLEDFLIGSYLRNKGPDYRSPVLPKDRSVLFETFLL